MLPYCVLVYWEEAWCMSWSEWCGCVMAFLKHVSDILWCSTAVAVLAQTSFFVCASNSNRKPMKLFHMCVYVWWLWKAQDYSNCIVMYPLQVRCNIVSRTKQQWATVVNSWPNKSRYKCGSCSTCQEPTNRCQTTQFKVACLTSCCAQRFLRISGWPIDSVWRKLLHFTF